MKALSHWMELKGHVEEVAVDVSTRSSPSRCFERGQIEDTEVMHNFFKAPGRT